MRQFLLHDAVATREKVHVVEAFFKNDSRLKDAMAFIVVIDDKKLVSFILVYAELGEHLILLNVFSWETDSVLYVAHQILLCRTKI